MEYFISSSQEQSEDTNQLKHPEYENGQMWLLPSSFCENVKMENNDNFLDNQVLCS